MYKDVDNFCNTCIICAKKKATNDGRAPLMPIPTEYPFQLIGMDIIGPLPQSESGNKYLLVFIDSLTKWAEVAPLKTMEAEEIAKN